jgi:hypothetical protein
MNVARLFPVAHGYTAEETEITDKSEFGKESHYWFF